MSNLRVTTCDEVCRELGVPSGAVDRTDLEAHLAGCPACAAEALRVRRLDQVWRLTRPTEPGEASWRSVWEQVREGVASEPAVVPVQQRTRWGRIWLVAAVAQAAAVLIAGVVLLRVSRPDGGPKVRTPGPTVTAAVEVEYELEEGQTLFLVLDDRPNTVVVKPRFVSTAELVAFDGETPDPFAEASQGDLVVLNVMEGLPE